MKYKIKYTLIALSLCAVLGWSLIYEGVKPVYHAAVKVISHKTSPITTPGVITRTVYIIATPIATTTPTATTPATTTIPATTTPPAASSTSTSTPHRAPRPIRINDENQ